MQCSKKHTWQGFAQELHICQAAYLGIANEAGIEIPQSACQYQG